MNVNKAISILEDQYDISLIFSSGLYHKFDNVERVYLDEFNLKQSELYSFLNKYLKNKLDDLLGEDYFICLLFYSEDEQDKDYLEELHTLEECGIQIPTRHIYRKKYIDDEELYTHYVFFEDNRKNLHKYIEETLARTLTDNEPWLPCEVYYVKRDLSKIVYIYDDRGMDILSLDADKLS